MHTLSKQLRVFIGCILGCFSSSALECDPVTLVLKTLWGNETLDFWCLGVWLLALSLGLNFSSNDELAMKPLASEYSIV